MLRSRRNFDQASGMRTRARMLFHARAIVVRAACALIALVCLARASEATIVRFSTSKGDIDVRLYNSATPQSVTNFLNYVTTQRFNDTLIHRSVPGFVIQ